MSPLNGLMTHVQRWSRHWMSVAREKPWLLAWKFQDMPWFQMVAPVAQPQKHVTWQLLNGRKVKTQKRRQPKIKVAEWPSSKFQDSITCIVVLQFIVTPAGWWVLIQLSCIFLCGAASFSVSQWAQPRKITQSKLYILFIYIYIEMTCNSKWCPLAFLSCPLRFLFGSVTSPSPLHAEWIAVAVLTSRLFQDMEFELTKKLVNDNQLESTHINTIQWPSRNWGNWSAKPWLWHSPDPLGEVARTVESARCWLPAHCKIQCAEQGICE